MTRVKRGEMKARRKRQRTAQRRGILIALVVGVVLLIAIIVGANIYENNRPVGDITTAEPRTYPAEGSDGTYLGDPNAPVKIEVFEDFQCPACKQFGDSVETQIITQMKDLIESGKVYYHFRQYPFIDDNAAYHESDKAALASMCAAEQGKFWQMKETIFANWKGENQGNFTDRRLQAMAQAIGLDMGKYNDCYDSNKYKAEIDADYEAGKKMGVSGTPSLFINGELLSPGFVPSYEEIKAKVDAILNQ